MMRSIYFLGIFILGLGLVKAQAMAADGDVNQTDPLSQVQCEHVLTASPPLNPGPLNMERGLYYQAYATLMHMDFTDGEVRAQMAAGLTAKALAGFFRVDPVKVQSAKLFMRTKFEGEAADQSSPEIEIYSLVKGENAKAQTFAVMGGSNNPLYYWKNLSEEISTEFVVGHSLLDNTNLKRLPLRAEVGFTISSENPEVVRRFVSIRDAVNLSYITLGFDVRCDKVSEFTNRPNSVLKVSSIKEGMLCRIPVLRSVVQPPR